MEGQVVTTAQRNNLRAEAQATAWRFHPTADRIEVTFYAGDPICAIWKDGSARLYRYGGYEL